MIITPAFLQPDKNYESASKPCLGCEPKDACSNLQDEGQMSSSVPSDWAVVRCKINDAINYFAGEKQMGPVERVDQRGAARHRTFSC